MSTISCLWLKLFNAQTEIQKRLFVGEKAIELEHGGIVKISKLTGLSRTTITKGIKELKEPLLEVWRVRKKVVVAKILKQIKKISFKSYKISYMRISATQCQL